MAVISLLVPSGCKTTDEPAAAKEGTAPETSLARPDGSYDPISASETVVENKPAGEHIPDVPEKEPVLVNVQYTVVPGDSLWKISRKHNTTVERIKEANKLTSDLIRPGQVLTVPMPAE